MQLVSFLTFSFCALGSSETENRSKILRRRYQGVIMIRRVTKVVLSVEQSEGVGARVRRSIGRKEVRLNC